MITKSARWFLSAAILACSLVTLSAAEPPKAEAAMLPKLLAALEKGDYQALISEGDAAFKTMPRERFDGAAGHIGPKLRNGYETSYLGDLNQKGSHVTLWKVVFKDGSDDALAVLTLVDGKVSTFVVR